LAARQRLACDLDHGRLPSCEHARRQFQSGLLPLKASADFNGRPKAVFLQGDDGTGAIWTMDRRKVTDNRAAGSFNRDRLGRSKARATST